MKYFYTFGIYCYYVAVWLAGFFNKKAKQWIEGRKTLFEEVKAKMDAEEAGTVWVHAASLGEFEQGRPLIDSFKKEFPECKIVLTFFSPSGYEIRKNYEKADYVFYMPLDTPANAQKFLDLINPEYVFFIKYEFWFNFLNELKERNIETYLVSGIFRPSQHFFKSYGGWFRKKLDVFSQFFVQNEESLELLSSIGFENVFVTGDTRFDRVATIAQQVKQIPMIEKFKGNQKMVIAGSSWQPDELLLQEFMLRTNQTYKLVIVPHEITSSHLSELKKMFPSAIFYSKINAEEIQNKNILIIDSIGLLSSLYQYGDLALIGGGFGKGIHNLLEAVTFGLPVCFGPNYQKFQEAIELIEKKVAFPVQNAEDFCSTALSLLKEEEKLHQIKETCKAYIAQKTGATQSIIRFIKHQKGVL